MTNEPASPTLTLPAEALAAVFEGGGANVSAARALEALSAADAVRVPVGHPHSVAAIVGHLHFWEAWILARLRGETPAWPEHASVGWPEVSEDAWEGVKGAFLGDLNALQNLTRDPEVCRRRTKDGRTVAESLLGFATHNVYHLGQIVTVRQALGLWPPPSGGDTW